MTNRLSGEQAACQQPPDGWWCSRGAGHDGPCAARPKIDPRVRARANFRQAVWEASQFMSFGEMRLFLERILWEIENDG